MPRTKKPDIIIEAVRYTSDGHIAFVRAHERRGNVWSDCLLLSRAQLWERLKKGQKVLTGRRQPYLGNNFETGASVKLVGEAIVLAGLGSSRDNLANTPLL